MIDVVLLGTGGMLPLPNRNLSSMMVRANGSIILFDCGEGTQVAIKKYGLGFKNIDCICITHFHADHITGLPGLLLTIGNSGRDEPITIIGPLGLKSVVTSLTCVARDLPFKLNFIEVENDSLNGLDFDTQKDYVYKKDNLEINAMPLRHGINTNCLGYSISLKRAGKFDIQKAKKNNVPQQVWSLLQKEEVVIYNNKKYVPQDVLGENRKGIKISFVTDTRPFNDIATFAQNSDLFVCESMYFDDDKLQNAKKHNHMIFKEAYDLFVRSTSQKMWLTHYSPAFSPSNDDFLKIKNFEGVQFGYDGMTAELQFEE